MRKLWFRFTLAFAVIVVITVMIIGIVTNWQVNTQFRRFVARFPQSPLMAKLTDYYATHGSWNGVEKVFLTSFSNAGPPPWAGGMGMKQAENGGMMGIGRLSAADFLLTNAQGHVVYDGSGDHLSDQIAPEELEEAIPILWQNRVVGYLMVHVPDNATLTPAAQTFLSQINKTLLYTGFIVGILGVLLGIIIARELSSPLARLEMAVNQFSQGNLDQRVSVTGTEEIANLAQAFNNMADNLQRARHMQKNLVADIAHELRTPISVLQGNLQAILEDVYPLEKSEIATIYDETLILSRLVNDLNELNKAETGRLGLNKKRINIAAIVEQNVALFKELSTEKGVTLHLQSQEEVPFVLADSGRVQQVTHNLLSNALHHTPSGGTIQVVVEHITQDDRSWVKVSVIDTGAGIPAEHLSLVFERFWRSDVSRSREHGGSGLGLSIAKHLIEAQGGHIGVQSRVGKGSCFWFMLPTYDQSD